MERRRKLGTLVAVSNTLGEVAAGAALKLMSSAVPVVGGLPVLVGEAL
ncbi:unnamed protein product, partial [Ectocarpus sp. 12 AP-2014]